MSNDCVSDNTWKSQAGFIWSLIGSAVGFANILSFSAGAYKSGGGAFLIPYCLALFVLGIPLLILEGVIGSRLKTALVSAYGRVFGSVGKTFGWLSVLACLTIGGFYSVLTGYSIAYTYFSLTGAIPEDSKGFFVNTFLGATSGITEFGSLSIPIFASTIAVAVATWFVLVRSVKEGIERICSIFMPLLAIIMTLFAVIVLVLPGGVNGLYYMLKPDFTKLLDPALWRDVFGQLFFSLSLGLGIIVGYSRHTGQTINIKKAMVYVALGDFMISFIAGTAIFGCIAHISYIQGIPFDAVLTTDSTFEIGFIVFPKIFQYFGPVLGQFIGVVFFFCLFVAGITGVFSIVESIAGNIEVEFLMTRKKAVTLSISAVTAAATLFCMGNASHLIDALVPMCLGTNMLIGGLALIFVFHYVCKETSEDPVWMRGKRWNGFALSLRTLAPALLLIILVGNLAQEFNVLDLAMALRWTWFMAALLISALLSNYASKRKLKTA